MSNKATQSTLYAIYGASGAGRGIAPIVKEQLCVSAFDEFVFVDDNPAANVINGNPVLSFDEFLSRPTKRKFINIGIADSLIREKLSRKCTNSGLEFFEVFADDVKIMDEVSIGEGAVFCNHTMVTVNVTIGRFFHCNLYSYVEHDCEIGDFVTFAPGVKCNGNVTIGNHAYIGSGAVIKQGIQIGEHATVGMGAVVVKDVPSHAVVAGNPAKVLKMKRNG